MASCCAEHARVFLTIRIGNLDEFQRALERWGGCWSLSSKKTPGTTVEFNFYTVMVTSMVMQLMFLS